MTNNEKALQMHKEWNGKLDNHGKGSRQFPGRPGDRLYSGCC